MRDIALSVGVCVRSGTHADVAWIVDDDGFGARDKSEALAITPGGGRIGGLLGGALNNQVAALVSEGGTRRLHDIEVDAVTALISGLDTGGRVRCLVVPADDFPDGFWDELWSGTPGCLVTHLEGDRVTRLEFRTGDAIADLGEDAARMFSRAVTDSLVDGDRVVTALWPVPRLAILGGGPICDALEAAARTLAWHVHRFTGAGEASPFLMGFGPLDMVLVANHDVDAAGSALAAALKGQAGYVGALGTVQMNEARRDWLVMRGVGGLDRIHGPAGLDIGARKPAEVAIAVIAEALAVRSGSTGRPLSSR